MHNIQNDQTTTAPTLADLLTARRAQLAAEQIEHERREQRNRERERLEALASIETFAAAHFSPTLAAALRMTPAVDDNLIALDDGEDGHDDPGYLMLSMPTAQPTAEPDDEAWSLVYGWRRFQGYSWMLRGPNGYTADLANVYSTDELLDERLLDAIAAYPEWLATADQRAEQQERKRQEREERRKQERPRHYAAVEGPGSYDGQRPGLLWTGTHVHVLTLDPRGEDGIMEWDGVLQSVTREWLLLNLDGAQRGSAGAQRLIPAARVLEIQPLPDVAPDAE